MCGSTGETGRPAAAFQIRHAVFVLPPPSFPVSWLAIAMRVPSGLKAAERTCGQRCSIGGPTGWPDATSTRRARRCGPIRMTRDRSGLNTAFLKPRPGPGAGVVAAVASAGPSTRPAAAPAPARSICQSLAVPSSLAVRRSRPSGENATLLTPSGWRRGGPMGRPVAASHRRAGPLRLAVAISRPSGENTASQTLVLRRGGRPMEAPVVRSPTCAVEFSPHMTTRRPSGDNRMAVTAEMFRGSKAIRSRVALSQCHAVPSALPVAMSRPSGDEPARFLGPCCRGGPYGLPVAKSQNRARPSWPPVRKSRPSGERSAERSGGPTG